MSNLYHDMNNLMKRSEQWKRIYFIYQNTGNLIKTSVSTVQKRLDIDQNKEDIIKSWELTQIIFGVNLNVVILLSVMREIRTIDLTPKLSWIILTLFLEHWKKFKILTESIHNIERSVQKRRSNLDQNINNLI